MIRPGLLAALFTTFFYLGVSAQNTVVNLNAQPAWGPAGYTYVSYYYLPAVESYYCINERRFIYLEGGRWIARPYLPKKYKKYDLFSGYKIVMNTSRPYLNFTNDRIRYSYYKTYKNKQKNLCDERKPILKNVSTKKSVKKYKAKDLRKIVIAEN